MLIIENIAVSFKPADQENPLERIAPLCTSDARLNVCRGSTISDYVHVVANFFNGLIGLLLLAS